MKTYKEIPNWEAYAISKCGEIIRIGKAKGAKTNAVLKQQSPKSRPYLTVRLHCHGKAKSFDVHKLMAITYFGQIPKNMNVCHINGNAKDNRLENLRIDTRSSNEKDKILHGTSNRGTKNGQNKYNNETIIIVKSLIKSGARLTDVERFTQIPYATLRHIKNNTRWAWL